MEKWLQLAEIVYKLGLPIAGAVALFLAYLRVSAANRQAEAQILQAESSIRQIDLGRWKQAIDFFVQSAGQLRDEKLEVRLAAVHTLRKLFDEFEEHRGMVIALLSEHLRDNPQRWSDADHPPADVREITKLLIDATRDDAIRDD